MFMKNIIFIIGALLINSASQIVAKKPIVCYIASWSESRSGLGKFSILDSNTNHCTHIIYAFIKIDETKHELQNISRGHGQDELLDQNLKKLKLINPHIKIMASIGGWSERGRKFSDIARSSAKRQKFIASVMAFIRTYSLDGIDICWQFPGNRGGRPDDKEHSIKLFTELKQALKPDNLLLTMHLLGKRYVMNKINIEALSKIVDFISLIPIQFNGPWDKKTGIMTPLTSNDENNVKYAVDYVLKNKANPDKLLLGVATFGETFIVEEKLEGKYIGLFSNKSYASPWTKETGIIGYNEICHSMTTTEGWNEIWHQASQTPLMYNNKKLITYDNERSILLKAKLAMDKKLAGIMVWSLDMDDFQGTCYGKTYPLISAIYEYINRPEFDVTTQVPKTESPQESTSQASQAIVTNFEYSSW